MSLFSEKQTVKLNVQGMHCQKCVARVKEALENADGVTSAEVDLDSNSAVAQGRSMDASNLASIITELGFPTTVA